MSAALELVDPGPVERPPLEAARPSVRIVRPCPNSNPFRGACKSPSCEVCGPIWAGDQRRVMESALKRYGGRVVLTDVTPPGEDRLPWACTRQHRTRDGRPLPHSGTRGCRVQQRPAREWMDTYTARLDLLRRAGNAYVRRRVCACGHTRRGHEHLPGNRRGACMCGACACSKFKGFVPNLVTRVHEPQKRGVPHWHGAFGYETLAERRAIRLWVAWCRSVDRNPESPTFGRSQLKQRDFGFCEGHLRPIAGREAARYLASYLTGRSAHKATMRQNVVDPAMTYWAVRDASARGLGRWEEPKPRRYRLPLVWVTPRLTSFKHNGTGLTMRTLRRTRQLWAVLLGRYRDLDDNPAPKWFYEVRDALETALIYRRQRGRDSREEDDAIAATVFDMIARFENQQPGWAKVLARRECMAFVRDLADVRPKLAVAA